MVTYRLLEYATVVPLRYGLLLQPSCDHLSVVFALTKLDLRSGREVHFKDQRRRRRSSLPTVLQVPDDLILMTPPPNPPQTGNAAGGTGAAGGAGATGAGTGTGSKTGPGTTTSGTGGTAGNATHGTGGTIPKANLNTTAGGTQSLAGPFPPAPDASGVLQITSAQLQQLLTSAVASAGGHREPPVPKLWESEPAAWFQVFRGHYAPRNLTQQALFNALLPLVPTSAVALCRPFVGSAAPDVFDQVERLLLRRFGMSPMERGKALYECTSLGDRTPEEMLQHMRSL